MKSTTIPLTVRDASHWLPGGTPQSVADFYRAPVARFYRHDGAKPYALGHVGGPRMFINGVFPRSFAVECPAFLAPAVR